MVLPCKYKLSCDKILLAPSTLQDKCEINAIVLNDYLYLYLPYTNLEPLTTWSIGFVCPLLFLLYALTTRMCSFVNSHLSIFLFAHNSALHVDLDSGLCLNQQDLKEVTQANEALLFPEQHRVDPARSGRVRAVAAVRGASSERHERGARRALAQGRGRAPSVSAHALLPRGLPRRAHAREGNLLYLQTVGESHVISAILSFNLKEAKTS